MEGREGGRAAQDRGTRGGTERVLESQTMARRTLGEGGGRAEEGSVGRRNGSCAWSGKGSPQAGKEKAEGDAKRCMNVPAAPPDVRKRRIDLTRSQPGPSVPTHTLPGNVHFWLLPPVPSATSTEQPGDTQMDEVGVCARGHPLVGVRALVLTTTSVVSAVAAPLL